MVSQEKLDEFKSLMGQKSSELYRDFLWRRDTSPYVVYLSEVMLQQTQTSRVSVLLPKFIEKFKDFDALANARLDEVIIAWQGLGYNRRAKFLHQSAKIISDAYKGHLPIDPAVLVELPGIGPNTAASIVVYAFNLPHAFVETNVRTVYIKHFEELTKTGKANDKEILAIVSETMDTLDPRRFFWGLMDYGVNLKKTVGNLSRLSKTYTKQSSFEGSLRQVRGRILKVLTNKKLERGELFTALQLEQRDLYDKALSDMVKEGFVAEQNEEYWLVGR